MKQLFRVSLPYIEAPKMFIYVIVCNESMKLYVGQHKGTDLQKYLHQKISHALHGASKRSRLYNAMRQHSKSSWSIWPIVAGVQVRAELDDLEKHFIQVLKTQHPDVGYNICRGGEGFTGPHTPETLQIMKEKVDAFWAGDSSQEHRESIRQMMFDRWATNSEYREKVNRVRSFAGRTHTEETKQKISLKKTGRPSSNKGTKCTEEQKRKISESLRQAWAEGRYVNRKQPN